MTQMREWDAARRIAKDIQAPCVWSGVSVAGLGLSLDYSPRAQSKDIS